MDQLEQAKLLTVATKLAKAEIEEARSQLLEQINSIQLKHGRDGRSIVDARIFEGDLTLQFSDGTVSNLGKIIGNTGYTGAKGEKGDQGEPGVPGPRGDTGLTGPAGKDGERGPRGDKGDKGDPGLKGEKGEQGDRGEQGEQGEQGIPGKRGQRGERGDQGPSGVDGTNGRDGNDGAKGKTGARGPQGVPGRDGKDGQDGAIGPQGPKGDKGDPGSDANTKEIEKKFDKLVENVDKRFSRFSYSAATGIKHTGSGEVWLHRLDDVDYTSVKTPNDGDALVWNASTNKWEAGAVSGGGGGGISNNFTTTVSTKGVIPSSDEVYSLGSASRRYKDLWLSNNSIHIGLLTVSATDQKLYVDGQSLTTDNYVNGRFIANNNARGLIAQKMSVANTKVYLANTNAYIATKVDTTTFNAAIANTNAYIASVAMSSGGGGATWGALISTNTAIRALVSDRLQIANAVVTFQTKTAERAALANTNSYIATKSSWGSLTSTNTALRGLISDRIQIANAVAIGATKATWGALTSTNTALRGLISDRMQVGNVNSNFLRKTGTVAETVNPNIIFSSNVAIQGKLVVTGGITTYSANNLVVGDNMIYLNANNTVTNPDMGFAGNYNDGTYHHAGFFRDASDNGTWKVFENYSPEPDANVYINTAHATFRLAPFSAQNIKITRNLTVVANSTLGNTSVTGFLKLNGTDIRASFAQNVSTQLAISARLQVANAAAIYQTKTIERAALANTNAFIASRAPWSELTTTNTAIRALVSDRLQIANVAATYQTKAVERAALANTNSYIASKVDISTFNAALANTNAYIASVAASGGGGNTGGGGSVSVTTKALDQLKGTDTVVVAVSGGGGGGTANGVSISSGDLFIGSMLLGGM